MVASSRVATVSKVVASSGRNRYPTGYGILGSLADHGVAELLLVLHRS
jgi:hypothetical protein